MRAWRTVLAPAASVLAALTLAACSEPSSRETFVRSDGSGEYSFPVAMPDSTAAYDILFYTVVDKVPMAPDTLASFPMLVTWKSPSGRYFSETVYYPVALHRVLYRSGIVPAEAGDWSLSVSVAPEPEGLRGLGLIVKTIKTEQYGE